MNYCIACKNESSFKKFKESEKVIICEKCNSIYTKNPVSEKIWYEDETNSGIVKKIKMILESHHSKEYSKEYIKYLKMKTKMNFKKVFEVGANRGFFIKYMNRIGIDSTGLESNKNWIGLSKSNKIKWGFFDENYETENKYDLVCLTHMIYFLRDNEAILKKKQKAF